jgi:hypothetical protein
VLSCWLVIFFSRIGDARAIKTNNQVIAMTRSNEL